MTDDASRNESGDAASRNESDDDASGTEFTHEEGDSAADADENTDPAMAADESASERSDPLADLADTVAEGTDRSRSNTPGFDDLFDRHDAAGVDGDRLWKRLEADRADEPNDADELSGEGESEDSAETAESDATLRPVDREVREVGKRSYCQSCEHFAEPPAVACTRDGTDILAVTSIETFRVADCPFVLEDEALERRH